MNRFLALAASALLAHLFFRVHPASIIPSGPFLLSTTSYTQITQGWLWNTGLLLQFFILHSLFAARDRSAFLAVNFFSTAVIWALWAPFPSSHLAYDLPTPVGIALLAIQSMGLVGFAYSLGETQVHPKGDAPIKAATSASGAAPDKLVVTGAYVLCRHPMLFSSLLIFAFPSWSAGRVLLVAASLAYIAIGIFLEEWRNGKKWGTEYEAYKKTTPMFFPTPKSLARFVREAHFPNPRVSRSK